MRSSHVDLSHWKLVALFTGREAAYLAIGADPNVANHSPEMIARASLVERMIGEAFQNAWQEAFNILEGLDVPPELILDDIWDICIELPSGELRNNYSNAVRDPKKVLLQEPVDSWRQAHFNSDDLAAWFKFRGFHPVFPFGDDYPPPETNNEEFNVSEKKSKKVKEATDSGDIHPRTKHNYLRLIMALAISYIPNFDPKRPYEAAKIIIDGTEIDLDQKTIAGYLGEAYELQSKARQ